MHKEVVTGIVQVIRHFANKRSDSSATVTLRELLEVSFRGKTEEAKTYICEFVKDGVVNLRQQDIDAVLKGDYGDVWKCTNVYLKRFGYDPVKPEPISLDLTTK